MEKFFEKPEEELQSLIDDAYRFCKENSHQANAKLIEVLLVIAERNRKHIEVIEWKNQIYSWLIIALSIAAIIAQILPNFLGHK